MVIGTPEYMSPEQARGKRGNDIDGRSDLYSLGIVMYRMLTGELPFQAETTVEIILQHLRTPPKAPHKLKPELAIPEAVSSIVMKALEKDREKRYATGAEMAAAIKKARGSITLASRKIDWGALSNAAASFGAEVGAPGPPATRTSATPARAAAPPAPVAEKPIYRSSARRGPPPREFPTRWVLMLVAAAVLSVGALYGWKYFQPWISAKSSAGAATAEPARTPELPPAKDQKTAEAPKSAPSSSAAEGEQPTGRKNMSFAEQARTIELNSLAAIYYHQGGCEKALPTYQQVLEIDPGNPRAYAAVQKCYSQVRNGVRIDPAPDAAPDASPKP